MRVVFDAAPVDGQILHDARKAGFDDYEDAVLHESARQAEAEGIVTRNTQDFEHASLTIFTPGELLAAIESTS